MDKFVIAVFGFAMALLVAICHIQNEVYAQLQPPSALSNKTLSQPTAAVSNKTSSNGTGVVSVSASVVMQVSNQTLDIKEKMLRAAVSSFLKSGQDVLKTSDSDLPIVKTKIANQINNAIQNVEGAEATNAIIGVEIGKALETVISPTAQKSHADIITVMTSSTCKPAAVKSISCDNIVTIK